MQNKTGIDVDVGRQDRQAPRADMQMIRGVVKQMSNQDKRREMKETNRQTLKFSSRQTD